MTRDLMLGEELPHWVGAKEFHQKYESKEVIGRCVSENYRLPWTELGFSLGFLILSVTSELHLEVNPSDFDNDSPASFKVLLTWLNVVNVFFFT